MNPEAAMKYMEGGGVKPMGSHKMPDGSMMSDNDPSMLMGGGKVMKYEKGGSVSGHSRGGGAALSGTKFTGVK